MREATAHAVAAGVPAEPLLLHGNPAEQIAQAALATKPHPTPIPWAPWRPWALLFNSDVDRYSRLQR